MKIKVIIIVFAVSLLCAGTTYGQTEFVALTSSQLLKGLTDKDYLNTVLTNSGFALVKNWKIRKSKSGEYDYWEYKSQIFLDVIYSPAQENYIIVRIHKDYADLSERLVQTFPHKSTEELDDHIDHINVSHINKETAYSLKYSKDGNFTGVDIWFDDPFYFFQYTNWKE
jgi:hypothetical protein